MVNIALLWNILVFLSCSVLENTRGYSYYNGYDGRTEPGHVLKPVEGLVVEDHTSDRV